MLFHGYKGQHLIAIYEGETTIRVKIHHSLLYVTGLLTPNAFFLQLAHIETFKGLKRRGLVHGQLRNGFQPHSTITVALFVMSAVSTLSGLHSTICMAFEMLPQSRTGGKALRTRLTPVWFVSCVYSTMVDQIPFRTKGLSALRARKWSLSSMLAHVNSKIKLFDKALTTVWTKMTLLIFDTDMPVHFVRFQLTFCHKTAATHVAKERLFACVDSQVVVQLCLASK